MTKGPVPAGPGREGAKEKAAVSAGPWEKGWSWPTQGGSVKWRAGEMISQAGECKNKRSRPTGKVVVLATVGRDRP